MLRRQDRTFRALQTELVSQMRETIRARGPRPFSWFMHEALYHPQFGYYSSGRAVIGRRGDYFTNVSVGPLFGRLIARQFVEMWERLDRPNDFTIAEQGGHDGQFACDVLEALQRDEPDCFDAVRYRLIEPFPVMQDRQRGLLKQFEAKVEWANELTPFSGVHFSNELLDAFPVDLRERAIGLNGDEFAFVDNPPNNQPNQSQLAWIDALSVNLERGFVLAIDYGFSRADYHEVVQARTQHRILDSPLQCPGAADISVHVNWADLAECAGRHGFGIAGFTDQHHFLTGLVASVPAVPQPESLGSTGLTSQLSGNTVAPPFGEARALQTLLHPEMLGRAFQVLCLTKAVGSEKRLAGFRFSRDPQRELGLT